MATGKKGAITFGLVYIPVDVYAATKPEEISFNQLAKSTLQRVRYVKTCADCKKELKPDDIVKAYQYEKGKYVTVTDEELEAIKTDRDKALKIEQFCDPEEISPIYFQKAYQVVAQEESEKPLELLRKAMLATGKVAVGTSVMGTSENVFVLMPFEDDLALITLYYESEVREIPKAVKHPKVSKQELKMAGDLIANLERPFDPAAYKDHYQEKLRDLLEKKIEGKEVTVEQESGRPSNIVDLMDALSASVKKTTKTAKAKTAKG